MNHTIGWRSVEQQIYTNQMSEVGMFWTFFKISKWGFSYVTRDRIPNYIICKFNEFLDSLQSTVNNGVCKFSLVANLIEKKFFDNLK